ncbi:hypothetical protein IQ260_10545 [Leptolyngbya cf. ectocarpi LEGE 11479]|uniref:Uncharacterized protein n=1 Tax=Leptolyngbya cf. ectocarpi LEGE 11479 TaxID=1828722 RepID=A0A928ZRV2_LEPEC|nr:hypothetical protein [Leptolyngbya ectocarpi]MBE9067093.1 hypothetical protein [Leptolyngbya cf. ectocarpi LEGE 11479]
MSFNPVWISGIFLWALALYLMFSPVVLRLVEALEQQAMGWLVSANKQNASGAAEFYASVMSIVPFVLAGGLCNYFLDMSLGQSWTLSFGIIACMGSGVYELGRRDGEANQD